MVVSQTPKLKHPSGPVSEMTPEELEAHRVYHREWNKRWRKEHGLDYEGKRRRRKDHHIYERYGKEVWKRFQDNPVCLKCGKKPKGDRKRVLHVHHLDWDDTNNDSENVVFL